MTALDDAIAALAEDFEGTITMAQVGGVFRITVTPVDPADGETLVEVPYDEASLDVDVVAGCDRLRAWLDERGLLL